MVRTGKGLVAFCLVLTATIFVADSFISLGAAVGVPYVLVVLISLRSKKKSFTLCIALLCSVLVFAGYFTSPYDEAVRRAVLNRFVAQALIWVAVAAGLAFKRDKSGTGTDYGACTAVNVDHKTDVRLITLCLLLAALIFFVDISIPLGVAGGVPYVAVILISLWSPQRSLTIYMAVLCSVLTVVGYFISPVGGEHWKVLSNRFLAEMVIWTSTMLGLGRKNAEIMLIAAHDNLEERVETRTSDLVAEVAERKRVEAVLEDQLLFFQTLIDNMPSPIFYKDTAGRYLGCNVAFEKSIGLSQGEIEGRTVYELAPKELADKYFEMDKKLFDNPGIQVYEAKVRYTDGKEHDILFNKATFTRADGTMVGLVGVMTDITGHRMAEQELDRSKRMLVSVLDTIPVRVFWKDLDLRYMGCNTAFAKDAGFESSDEIIGKDDSGLVWAKEAGMYRADDSRVVETGVPKLNYEELLSDDKGVCHWFKTSKVPLRDANGDIIGVLGTYEDITERKRAEEQIRKLSHAVEQSFECVVITDTDGTVEYVNPYFTELTGYSFDEVVGQNPRLLMSGEHSRSFYKKLWDTIKSGRVWRGQFLNKKKSGELYWENASISPIRDETGRLTHFIAVKEDITERKRAEERLKEKSEKLDLLNKDLHELTMEITRIEETEKRRFAELLHDDIGQNLVAVKMALSNTLKHASGFKPDTRSQLGDANALLESTIGSLRALSSDLYPVTPYVEGLIDKKGLIDALRWHEKNILNPAGIETNVEITPAVEGLGDDFKRQIYMVLQESLQNIMKHASATKVSVFCGLDANTLLLSIKDNGHGFVNNDSKLKKAGGVGLRLMRERVKSMGGELIIESEKSKGTEVRAEFNNCYEEFLKKGVDKEG